MNKKYLILFLLFFAGLIIFIQIKSKSDQKETLVGGDRDKHGCIGSAGYIWCEAKQKCLRQWEEACESENKTE